ncbi:MAG: hypothetical protein EOO16_08820 [Chitinophagaceae bacterium]|nr:MAG: hypothetical protein EOO16_08820 [Chitinophagaceae bacterium]
MTKSRKILFRVVMIILCMAGAALGQKYLFGTPVSWETITTGLVVGVVLALMFRLPGRRKSQANA